MKKIIMKKIIMKNNNIMKKSYCSSYNLIPRDLAEKQQQQTHKLWPSLTDARTKSHIVVSNGYVASV